jgi:hypothetical protein
MGADSPGSCEARTRGNGAHNYGHAPRQGCEGSRSFNPSGVVYLFPTVTRGRFAPRAIRSHASGVKTSQRDGNLRTHPPRDTSLASVIPEGWEPIAPGRAKHAPGEKARHDEHAPRQGCEGSRSFNPSGVVHPFPRVTRGRFAPRAIRSHASGVKTSQRDGNPRTPPARPHTTPRILTLPICEICAICGPPPITAISARGWTPSATPTARDRRDDGRRGPRPGRGVSRRIPVPAAAASVGSDSISSR